MNILLLEDNATDADLTQRGLTGSIPNCKVEVAQNIKQAKKFLEKSEVFDIALLDMKLPDGTGMDLLVEIRQSGLQMPVLILTGSGNEEVAAAAMKAGADDYIVKRQEYISKLPGLIDSAIQNHQQNMLLSSEIVEVLYIEHHASDIDLTKRHFNQYAPQIHITSVSSADEALKLLPLNETEQAKFQVIILDYRLPGLNALEFTKIIRQERKLHVPVILVTGQGNEEVAIQALKLGVNEYLVKRDNYLYRLPSMVMNTHQHYQLIQKQVALIKSESKYRLLAENSGDVIFTADLDMHYTYVSPSVYQLRGYTSEEVMQQTVEDTLTPSSFAIAMKVFSDTMTEVYSSQTGKADPSTIELEMTRKDGSFVWTEVKATLLFDDNKQPINILGVTRDISVKRKYEQELVRAKENAEESDRLKSAFLANMSHEIRTPMNGILGFSDLLKEPLLSSEKQREYIDIIEKSGARMLNIINDIIDISRIEAREVTVRKTDCNICLKLDLVHDLFYMEANQKGLELIINNTVPLNECRIDTDDQKLEAILVNLIKNAIKFTSNGTIEIGCMKQENYFLFFVKDTGAGIYPELQDVIFERFRQGSESLSRSYEGAGLGLSISKAYAELLGGTLWVESKLGEGSCFFFKLPEISNPIEINQIQPEVKENVVLNTFPQYKMLIVDDDLISLKFLEIISKALCKELLIASSGTEAIELLKNHADTQLVLMDIKMPVLNGYEATRQIREFNKEVIIIAQTAFSLVGDREKALAAGCNDYISKPINKEKLKELIRLHVHP